MTGCRSLGGIGARSAPHTKRGSDIQPDGGQHSQTWLSPTSFDCWRKASVVWADSKNSHPGGTVTDRVRIYSYHYTYHSPQDLCANPAVFQRRSAESEP